MPAAARKVNFVHRQCILYQVMLENDARDKLLERGSTSGEGSFASLDIAPRTVCYSVVVGLYIAHIVLIARSV